MAKKASKIPERVAAYQRVFTSADGEKVLHDLMKQYYLTRPTYGASIDPDVMLVREGQRSVVLSILNTLKLNVSKMREHINKQQEDNHYDD